MDESAASRVVESSPPRVVDEAVHEHPAAVAWRQVRPEAPEPLAIEVLCERRKGSSYRLVGAGDGGEDVIAKLSPNHIAAVERTVYQRVLAHLPLDLLRYHGSLDAGADAAWIFVERAGDGPWLRSNSEHAALAGRWAARLHVTAAETARIAGLPELGLREQLVRINHTRDLLQEGLGNPALTAADRKVVTALAAVLERITFRWGRVDSACRGVPATLVHGDLRPKNSRIVGDGSAARFLVFDWETAGYGIPAADLARVDVDAYAAEVCAGWPQLDRSAVRRLAAVGDVFQQLDAIRWDAIGLHSPYQEKRVMRLAIYLERLGPALRLLDDGEALP